MFRGILAIALITSLLCGQFVAVQHTHAGMTADQQREHDAHPHVHVGTPAKHSHHHHSHHKHAQHTALADASQAIAVEHDADAIYVKSHTLSNQSPSLADYQLASTPLALHDGLLLPDALVSTAARWHPPDKLLTQSNLYLLLRNLRI